jgi:hypothetical protein
MGLTADRNTVLANDGYTKPGSEVFHDRRAYNVPLPYVPVDQQRDPHANPLVTSPRRMYARAPGPSALGGLVEQVYRGQPTHRAGDE